jgi:DNA-binding NtrC family response regulator
VKEISKVAGEPERRADESEQNSEDDYAREWTMPERSKPPILIVDDEPEILFSLRGLLRLQFEVQTATSGEEALRILRERPVHVIMTDQRMPEMTGVELLRRAQGACPEAIRMIFTGYSDIKAVIDAINEGQIFRYITKPWDPDELIAVLRSACDEYERIAERRQLVVDARDFLGRCLGGLERVPGEEATALAAEGRALQERLDRALS